MNPNAVLLFGSIAAIVAIISVSSVLTEWVKARGRTHDNQALTARLDEIAERLAQLDTAVDTVAVEVERISEAQRFTAKVLAERSSAASAIADASRSKANTNI